MKRLLFVVVAVAALAAPSAALAGGIVIKVERGAHLIAVANASGHVVLAHSAAAGRLHVGDRVALRARTLRNGTLAASRIRVLGRARTVRFRGLVLAKSARSLKVSAAGAVVRLATRHEAAAKPGAQVEVEAAVENDKDELEAEDVAVISATAPGGTLEGHLLAIGTSTITVGSEHIVLVLNVPAGFDLTAFKVGDEVLATFAQQSDGTLLLTKLSGDENAEQADEDGSDDGGGDNGGGGDGGGDH
jgi:hypothetical protein